MCINSRLSFCSYTKIVLFACSAFMVFTTFAEANDSFNEAVKMTNTLKFTPQKITVNTGDTVIWKNTSLLVHTVTADPELAAKEGSVALPEGAKAFNSGNLEPGRSYKHKFRIPGRYKYFCIPHEGAGMVGEVIVK